MTGLRRRRYRRNCGSNNNSGSSIKSKSSGYGNTSNNDNNNSGRSVSCNNNSSGGSSSYSNEDDRNRPDRRPPNLPLLLQSISTSSVPSQGWLSQGRFIYKLPLHHPLAESVLFFSRSDETFVEERPLFPTVSFIY
jgi:hypothetical protein